MYILIKFVNLWPITVAAAGVVVVVVVVITDSNVFLSDPALCRLNERHVKQK